MSRALQVSFRGLPPSERLVALAAERYRQMQRLLPGHDELLVTLEREARPRRAQAFAFVLLRISGSTHTEAMATHSDPHVALSTALGEVQTQLGMFVSTHAAASGWK